jgi:hypothetical protein
MSSDQGFVAGRPHEDDATVTVRKDLLDESIDPGRVAVHQCGLDVSLLDRYLLGQSALSKSDLRDQFERCRNYFVAYPA